MIGVSGISVKGIARPGVSLAGLSAASMSRSGIANDGPTLDRLFTGAVALDPRMSLVRASNRTVFNAAGTLITLGSNAIGFDTDPGTLQSRGLLLEEARTNLLLRSETANLSPWNVAEATVSTDTTTAPDGTLAGDSIIPSTNNTVHILYQASAAVSAGATVTLSAYFKPAGYNFVWLRFGDSGAAAVIQMEVNLATGVISVPIAASGTGAVAGVGSVTAAGNGWYRVAITGSITALTSYTCFIYPGAVGGTHTFVGNGTSGIAIWGAQMEVGSAASAYIATVAATASRAQDTLTMPAGTWFNPSAGTWAIDFVPEFLASSGQNRLLAANTSTSATPLAVGGGILTSYDGAGQISTANAPTANALNKAASSWSGNSGSVCLNAGAVVTGAQTTGFSPIATFGAQFFAGGSTVQSGWLRRLRYWPRALAAGELQQVTT